MALIQHDFSASTVIPSVRGIHIQGPPNALPAWDTHKMAAIAKVISLLTSPGNITKFSLRNLAWAAPPWDGPYLDLSGLSTVSTLELLQTNFPTRAELIVFLENFKGLRHLVLEDVNCVSQTPSVPMTLPSGSYGLALRCPEDFSLRKRLRWDCDASDSRGVSPMELADLAILMSGRHHEIADILRAFGCTLHRLQLATQTIRMHLDHSAIIAALTHLRWQIHIPTWR
ncbi:hypothetical protein C0991_002974 [Blastosporella zonata]|nr:hypothetical protein C0991_002974 [Blastosporella zonata]